MSLRNAVTAFMLGQTKSPQAATLSQIRHTSSRQGMLPEWDARQAYDAAYISSAFVFAAIKAVASDLSSLPFRTGTQLPEDISEPSEFDTKTALAKLLGPPPYGPSPTLSARRLWAWSVAQRLITGRLAWEIEESGRGVPVALWPLLSRDLRAIPSEGGTSWFSGFLYGQGVAERRLSVSQVFYSWIPSQNDFRQAESPLQAARLPIDIQTLIDRYDHGFLRNDAVPAAIITHQRIDDPDDRAAWRSQYLSNHQGSSNSGKVAFNEVDADVDGKVVGTIAVERLGLSQKDAQLAELHSSAIQAILVALGVPMSRLMDASGRTFANGDQEWLNYWQSTIRPLALDLADDVNTQLAPRLGSSVGWFDMSTIKGLHAEKERTYQSVGLSELVTSGVVSAAWAAAQVGAPVEGLSDVVLHPLAQEFVRAGRDVDGSVISVPSLQLRSTESSGEKVSSNVSQIKRIQVVDDDTIVLLEAQYERAVSSLFRRQVASTVSKLEGRRGRAVLSSVSKDSMPDASQVFDPVHWSAETSEVLVGLYLDTGTVSVNTLAKATEADEFLVSAAASAVSSEMKRRANLLAPSITDTTFDEIKSAISSGIVAGEGIPELSRRVRAVFSDASKTRATLIARTEVLSAYNQATITAAASMPSLVAAKQWLSAKDERTRETHRDADGQVVPVTAPFVVGGKAMDAPGEPNCRCTVLLLSAEEYAQLTST